MINKETVLYSLRNLKQRRSRSFLTIFSILIGIATIFIFISFGYGLYNYTNTLSTSSSADKLLIMSKGVGGIMGLDKNFKLTEDDLKAVKKAGGVYEATGVYFKTSEIKVKKQLKYAFLVSFDPNKPLVMDVFNTKIIKGRNLRQGDTKKVVLGYNYLIAKKIFNKALEINSIVKVDGVDMRVIGFYDTIGNPQDDSNVYITNKYLAKLHPNKTYVEIIAKVDIKNVEKVMTNIEKNLRKQRGLKKGKEDFFVQSFDDLLKSFSKVLNIIVGFIILIALISIIVSVINTANTMVTSVLERYKEIGILKAIGAKNSEIFGIFLFESSFLGFVAGVFGVLLGWGFSSLTGSLLKSLGWGFISPSYSTYLFMGLILFATVTGAISGIFPAYKASKTNVVEAIRYE